MVATLHDMIHHTDDHVVFLDLGEAEGVKPRVVSLGKAFDPVGRAPVIV